MATPLYSTSFNISQFSGINQSGDGYNMNMQYAREMENVNIEGGSFRPMREGTMLEQTLEYPIGTLACLHRRFGADTSTLLVAVSNGTVYTKTLDGTDEWEDRYIGLTVNDCDYVTYEISLYHDYDSTRTYSKGQRVYHNDANYKCLDDNVTGTWNSEKWEELTGTDPVDILLFSNATDGMFCLYGDTLDVVPVETPKLFGVLARYNERIWGAGIEGDPDMLVYSAPYDPFDWTQNNEIPEDGAGDIQQPSWDGDRFLALRQYGSDLLAIRRNAIWRIYGTNPGEFQMQKQYGGGSIAENTVCVYNQYAFMLGEYGLMRYDGNGCYPFQQEAIQQIMRERVRMPASAPEYVSEEQGPAGSVLFKVYVMGDIVAHEGTLYRCIAESTCGEWDSDDWEELNANPMHGTCAGMWNGTYCLALPLDGSGRCNAILQYDPSRNTFALRTEVTVSSFLQVDERLFYTTDSFPGTVWELDDNKGYLVKPVKWISGYQDLGLKNSIKSAFIAYLMVDSEVPVELWLGIRTEKKLKQKIIRTKPGKLTRVQLNTHGRIFRLEIRSYASAPYTISGGIRVDLELDPD
jgi:hypothetical protein